MTSAENTWFGTNMKSNLNDYNSSEAARKEYLENLYLENLNIGKLNPYTVSSAYVDCDFDNNTYIGSDAVNGADAKSLMRMFSANTVLQKCENIFI